jgi:hypothetical protein
MAAASAVSSQLKQRDLPQLGELCPFAASLDRTNCGKDFSQPLLLW